MKKRNLGYCLKIAPLLLACFSFSSLVAVAQTTTTYTYDSIGRVVVSSETTGTDVSITYDDANNITDFIVGGPGSGGSGSNNIPVCSAIWEYANSNFHTTDGTISCTDDDGDTLTVTNVTDPTGPATSTIINSPTIGFNNVTYNFNVTVSVSDGNGGSASYVMNVVYQGCSGPGCT